MSKIYVYARFYFGAYMEEENYLRILHLCDIEVGLQPADGATAELHQIQPFVEYIKEQLIAAEEMSIKAAKGESIEEEDDFQKQIAVLQMSMSGEAEERLETYSAEHAWDILTKFHKPFAKKLEANIASAFDFFNNIIIHYAVSNKAGQTSYPMVQVNEGLTSYTDNDKTRKGFEDAKSIYYQINLSSVKRKYKMKDITVSVSAHITFEDTLYTFASLDKVYRYGQLPSVEDVSEVIKAIKTEILEKIQAASQK